MILLYTGTPGSGKSLHLAHDIYYYLNNRKSRMVICNFPVNLELVKHAERFILCENDRITPNFVIEKCRDYWSSVGTIKENEVVFIVDECQLLFNSRSWNEAGRKEWLSFFSQHRKYGVLCILVCQFDMMIDKQIRALIEYEVVHRKLTNFGFIGTFLKIITLGDVFVAVEKWYSIGKKTGSYLFKARKKYYNLYNTFDTFEKGEKGKNEKIYDDTVLELIEEHEKIIDGASLQLDDYKRDDYDYYDSDYDKALKSI